MVVIYGESNSGKSTKAIKLLDPSKKSLYFALDFDKNIKKLELLNKNIQVTAYHRSSFLIDLEFEILNHGGLYGNKLSYVVIDPINFLVDNNKKGLAELLIDLIRLEKEYNKFELIVVVNTLHHFEMSDKIKKLPRIKFIESKKKKVITL
jgi:ABC-type oligopeptide transport system ATPase subunit